MNIHIPKVNRPAPPNPKFKSANYDLPEICHRYKLSDNAEQNRMAIEGVMLEKFTGVDEEDHWIYAGNPIKVLEAHIKSNNNPDGLVDYQKYNTKLNKVV